MNAEEILNQYNADFDAPRAFDEKHPEDGVLSRHADGLPQKPLNAEQVAAVIELVTQGRADLIPLLVTEVEAGTGKPAAAKAAFLERVASGKLLVKGLSAADAVTHLGYMKGGHNIAALVRLLENEETGEAACRELAKSVLIHQHFDAVARLCEAENPFAAKLMRSWANAEWFSRRAPLPNAIRAVVFKIPDEIEASTDFLSHSKGGHTRTDVPFHAKHYCMNAEMLAQIEELKHAHPHERVVLVADKIGTSSSRKSGMNNMEWIFGIENDDTRFMPAKKTQAIIFAGSVLGPVFGKTAADMGSVIARVDTSLFQTGDSILVCLQDGCVTQDNGGKICDFLPEKPDLDALRAGGGTVFRMGKILTGKARAFLKTGGDLPYAAAVSGTAKQPMTRAQKILARAAGLENVGVGQTVYPRVHTVASQDTTGPMTVQELQGTLCATKLATPLFLQSQCHNAALGFRVPNVVAANEALVGFIKELGGVGLNMGDGIIHSWLNEVVLPDTVVVGGDSHTRVPTALSFPQGSGGVAEAAATGVTEIVVPDSVCVTVSGEFNAGITVRDLVNYIAYKALKVFGKNVFEGSIIEFKRVGQPFDMIDVFKLTNSSAERSAAAACFELDGAVVAAYLKNSSVPVLRRLIDEGYDVNGALAARLVEFENFINNPVLLRADDDARYAYSLDVDLAEITEPYIACPHTPDNVRPLSELSGTPVGFGFIGSCMSGAKDFTAFERILRGVEKPAFEIWAAAPTRLVQDRLEALYVLKSLKQKGVRVEVSGCSLCMGNQERVRGEKNVVTTSTRNFKARMGDDASVYLVSAELEAVCALTGEFPTVDAYMKAVKND